MDYVRGVERRSLAPFLAYLVSFRDFPLYFRYSYFRRLLAGNGESRDFASPFALFLDGFALKPRAVLYRYHWNLDGRVPPFRERIRRVSSQIWLVLRLLALLPLLLGVAWARDDDAIVKELSFAAEWGLIATAAHIDNGTTGALCFERTRLIRFVSHRACYDFIALGKVFIRRFEFVVIFDVGLREVALDGKV